MGYYICITYLDLEHGESVEPGDEARQCGLARPGHSDHEEMALWLAEDPVDPEDVVQDLVEQNERNVELLFVEDLKGG